MGRSTSGSCRPGRRWLLVQGAKRSVMLLGRVAWRVSSILCWKPLVRRVLSRYGWQRQIDFFLFLVWPRGNGSMPLVLALSHLAVDHASLSRRSTAPTPSGDTSNVLALITSFHMLHSFCAYLPSWFQKQAELSSFKVLHPVFLEWEWDFLPGLFFITNTSNQADGVFYFYFVRYILRYLGIFRQIWPRVTLENKKKLREDHRE